ncbi:aminoglycoside phosphotransferase family protein [Marinilongibacter aquaticus]|uniref:phosphotransferase enzyme family protein n=1 Tax=Marinilongibacter aquaticus TaxID=2975157 RepID=UPI0021BD6A98|nr:aminoglycoside phosphotransferase family protein [Marinilongibacter aquaticus]UBM60883.1 aminoglycoside phosphotransferase family protein [Marinilongibacter aquaticus]
MSLDRELELAIRFFLPDEEIIEARPFGEGLINHTYLIKGQTNYLLQEINSQVFKTPENIDQNICAVGDYLARTNPDYTFINPIKNPEGQTLAKLNNRYWRMSPFLENTYSPNVLKSSPEAFQAAKAFGALTKNLNGLDISALSETIPDFHNLNFRVEQFKSALANGNKDRIEQAAELIEAFEAQLSIDQTFSQIVTDKLLPKRIQHHDTKINNVLFDKSSKTAKAVCDLDTLMPGYFISDLGDMIRTYTSAEGEESTEWAGVNVRVDFYKALMEGYLSETSNILTQAEKSLLFYAGEFMIFMQGIRFLSDFIEDDKYYQTKYATHNFNRAKNQLILLEDLQSKKEQLLEIIEGLI